MTKAHASIKRGLEEALAYSRGERIDVKVHSVRVPKAPDVAAIRQKSGLSQQDFAQTIGVAVGTLRGWEQGRRAPQGAARVLLALLAQRPSIVLEELASQRKRA